MYPSINRRITRAFTDKLDSVLGSKVMFTIDINSVQIEQLSTYVVGENDCCYLVSHDCKKVDMSISKSEVVDVKIISPGNRKAHTFLFHSRCDDELCSSCIDGRRSHRVVSELADNQTFSWLAGREKQFMTLRYLDCKLEGYILGETEDKYKLSFSGEFVNTMVRKDSFDSVFIWC